MAKYEHLNIYKEVYNLSKILFLIVSKFPRDFRITLGNKIINTIIEILELVIAINSTLVDDRKTQFSKFYTKINILSVYIRLSNDLNLFNKETIYLSILGTVSKISKMSKNWEG